MRTTGVRVVLGMVAAMWALEVIDAVLRQPLDSIGIVPRTAIGLLGIAAAPFLHFGFGHLLANTLPFLVLGLLVAAGGVGRVLTVIVMAAAVSGLAVWLLAPASSVTVGASGVVFGFAAYLIARGVRSRRVGQLAVAVAVVAVFGLGLLGGLVPRAGVSWVGHLFGALGGAAAARVLAERQDDRAATPQSPPSLR